MNADQARANPGHRGAFGHLKQISWYLTFC
jgi:hypothetical protein